MALVDVLNGRDRLLIDLDGVVYTGQAALPGAPEAIHSLRNAGYQIVFLTNNSVSRPEKIRAKLAAMGIEASKDELMTSGTASAQVLKARNLDLGFGICVIGSQDLASMVELAGLALAGPDDCGALLVGMDPTFSYEGISQGLRALARGIPWAVCNRDPNYPVEGGRLEPGCGAMVGALEGASCRRPDLMIGKPSRIMADIVCAERGWNLSRCAVIGDGLYSDMPMARELGVPGIWIGMLSECPEAANHASGSARSLDELVRLLDA